MDITQKDYFPLLLEWYLALLTSEEIRRGRGRE